MGFFTSHLQHKQPAPKMKYSLQVVTEMFHWVVPENIRTPTMGGILEFRIHGGFFGLEFRIHRGVAGIGIPNA